MTCDTLTYTSGNWIVTEKHILVSEAELQQYGGIGNDSGWIGNPLIKQVRYIVAETATELESGCCSDVTGNY